MADSTDIPDSTAQDDAAIRVPARGGRGLDPRRILWLVVMAFAGAVVLLGVLLFRKVSTERALQAVTSSVSLPATPASTAAVPAMPAPPAAVAAAPAPPATPQVADAPPASVPAMPPTAAAVPGAEARQAVRKVKSKKKARQAAQRGETAAARGTFARCPALGKPGAVMCRWHICNGGAGREAACRPYLERRP